MARTDIHRPSAIQPEEYDFVACDYFGGGLAALDFQCDRAAFQAHMAATGGKFAEHIGNGVCHICNARASYVARFHHLPTNTYITTGMDCAYKMGIGDPVVFAHFKKRVKAGLKTQRGILKAKNLLEASGVGAAFPIWEDWKAGNINQRQEGIIYDVVSKVVRYGTLTDGQQALLGKLLTQIVERPAIEAKRAADADAAQPVPDSKERMQVSGVIVSKQLRYTQFGAVVKILIQHDTGYKLWGTLPSELSDAVIGSKVKFMARVERSKDSDKFGFFSRPSKAAYIGTNEVQL